MIIIQSNHICLSNLNWIFSFFLFLLFSSLQLLFFNWFLVSILSFMFHIMCIPITYIIITSKLFQCINIFQLWSMFQCMFKYLLLKKLRFQFICQHIKNGLHKHNIGSSWRLYVLWSLRRSHRKNLKKKIWTKQQQKKKRLKMGERQKSNFNLEI